MDFGMFLDFSTRQGRGHESAFQEAFDLVDLAEETGLDTVSYTHLTLPTSDLV